MRAIPRTWPSILFSRLAQDALMSFRMRAIYPRRDAERVLLGPTRSLGCGQILGSGSQGHDLYLPNASADPAGRPGFLSNLRHGAGAGTGRCPSGAQSRTRGHDAPVLGRPRARDSRRRARNGRPPYRSPHAPRPELVELAAVSIRHAGSAVGGLPVLRARLAIA